MMKLFLPLITLFFSSSLFAAPADGPLLRKFAHDLVQKSDLIYSARLNPVDKNFLQTLQLDYPGIEFLFLQKGSVSDLVPQSVSEHFSSDIHFSGTIDSFLAQCYATQADDLRQLLAQNRELFVDLLPLTSKELQALFQEAKINEIYGNVGERIHLDEVVAKVLTLIRVRLLNDLADLPFSPESIAAAVKDVVYPQKKAASEKLAHLTEDQLQLILNQVPNRAILGLSEEVVSNIQKIDLSQSDYIRLLLNADFDIPDKNMKDFAGLILSNYFNADMPLETKRNILKGVLKLTPAEHDSRLESTVLKNTDILFKKAIQFLSDKSNNVQFKALGNQLKADLDFLDESELDAIIHKNFSPEQLSKITGLKQVAAATTAVGAMAKYDQKNIFIKIQRPGLRINLEKDRRRFMAVAKGRPEVEAIITAIAVGVEKELDLKTEIINYEIGKLINDDADMMVPSILRELPTTSELFVMMVAKGTNLSRVNLDKLSDASLLKLHRTYFNALQYWFRNSMSMRKKRSEEVQAKLQSKIRAVYQFYHPDEIISDEFIKADLNKFHADLHGGNVFINLKGNRKDLYALTWIDWGNTHSLSLAQQRGQVALIMGSMMKDPAAILDALKEVIPFTSAQKTEFAKRFKIFLETKAIPEKFTGNMTATWAISIALEIGAPVPEVIVNWARGKGMLENSLNELSEEVQKRGILTAAQVNLYTPEKAYAKVLLSYLKRDLTAQIFSSDARAESVIPIGFFGKFIFDHAKEIFSHYCSLQLQTPAERILEN